MNLEEVDIEKTIQMTGDQIGYFHLSDSNRQAPGQGHLDLPGILRALYQTGYRGVVSAEIYPKPDSISAVQRTANFIHALGNDLKHD
jgi:sugar phosphate isomerase/epimerase